MNHDFLNQVNILQWRFSNSVIFGIWHDCNLFFLLSPNTMSCCHHKMERNNWSRAESDVYGGIIHVLKWYHKAPFFFCGRKSLIIYLYKDSFQKKPTKVCDLFAVQNSFIHRYYRMKTQTKQKDHMKLHLKFDKSEIYLVLIMKY